MNVIYDDKTKAPGEGFKLLQQTTNQLQEFMGSYAQAATVEWDRVGDDNGQSLFKIKLRNPSGEVSTSFDLEELRRPTRVRIDLLHMFGELLKIESHQLLDNLKRISRED